MRALGSAIGWLLSVVIAVLTIWCKGDTQG